MINSLTAVVHVTFLHHANTHFVCTVTCIMTQPNIIQPNYTELLMNQ